MNVAVSACDRFLQGVGNHAIQDHPVAISEFSEFNLSAIHVSAYFVIEANDESPFPLDGAVIFAKELMRSRKTGLPAIVA